MIDNPIEVMLAAKQTKPIEYYSGWRLQEKSDGVRALIVRQNDILKVFGRNQTKKGRAEFTPSLPEVEEFFRQIDGDFAIDCELMSKDFITLQTKVRTTKTVVHDPLFYLKAFDIVCWGDYNYITEQVTHDDRYNQLQDFISQFGEQKFLRSIVQAPHPITPEYVEQCMQKVLAKGGEGLVIKNPKGIYQPGKRSKDWVKVLPYREMDVLFTSAVEGEGKYKGMLGALEAFGCNEKGEVLEHVQFHVGTGWDDIDRARIWKKAQLDLSFFPISGKISMKDIYPTGIPRMPVFKSFNSDKELK